MESDYLQLWWTSCSLFAFAFRLCEWMHVIACVHEQVHVISSVQVLRGKTQSEEPEQEVKGRPHTAAAWKQWVWGSVWECDIKKQTNKGQIKRQRACNIIDEESKTCAWILWIKLQNMRSESLFHSLLDSIISNGMSLSVLYTLMDSGYL